jgi:hypothetical protein
MHTNRLVDELLAERDALRTAVSEQGQQVVALRQQVIELQAQLVIAEERIAELESAKKGPPGFVKPNKPKREGSKAPRRKRAAEHNHGRPRSEVITRREEHHVGQCPECGTKLRREQQAWEREAVDIPPPPAVEVTEHVVYKGYCPRCGQWHHAKADLTDTIVGQRRFGPRLIALVGYLFEELRMTVLKAQVYLKTVHGVHVSAGALEDLRQELARQLEPTVEQWRAEVRSSPVVHADETGWREDGRNGYIWGFSTPGEQGIRCYLYDHSRGQHVVAAFLGEEFRGVLVTDFYGGYNVHRGPHQRCWVHLLRALHELKEEHPTDESVQGWALALRALYDRGKAFVDGGAGSQEEREKLYVALWSEAERLGLRYARTEHPCRALSKRVLRHLDELFQFVLVAGLAADNNLAERSLRPLVVVRKISGGSRSPEGSRTRMILATIYATLQARGLNPYTACLDLIRENS